MYQIKNEKKATPYVQYRLLVIKSCLTLLTYEFVFAYSRILYS